MRHMGPTAIIFGTKGHLEVGPSVSSFRNDNMQGG
jgi:hypothetical protein